MPGHLEQPWCTAGPGSAVGAKSLASGTKKVVLLRHVKAVGLELGREVSFIASSISFHFILVWFGF